MKKIIDVIIPHAAGLLIITLGWYITINQVIENIAMAKSNVPITKGTGTGLLIIIAGAYISWIWTGIRGKMNRN